MDWFTSPPDLGPAEAAWIARGMRQVAQADGVIHEREMNLIASFEAGVGRDTSTTRPTLSEALRTAWLRSLIMVALADGVISDPELEVIRDLAQEEGIEADEVDAEVLTVKRRFLGVFAGVNVFRDAVVRVARDLGLSESELDALRQEA